MLGPTELIKRMLKKSSALSPKLQENPEKSEEKEFVMVKNLDIGNGFKDEIELANRYCNLSQSISDAEKKLERLKLNKAKVADNRFQELNSSLTSFLKRANPLLVQLRERLLQIIDGLTREMNRFAEEINQIRKKEVTASGTDSEKAPPEKKESRQKSCKELYISTKSFVEMLERVVDNDYNAVSDFMEGSVGRYEKKCRKHQKGEKGEKRDFEKDAEKGTASAVQRKKMLKGNNASVVKEHKKEILKEVEIPCGTRLNVVIEGIAMTVTSTFVGLEKKEYILITYPYPYSQIKQKMFAGNRITVQYPHGGNVFVFVTQIIEKIAKPIRVVVLAYPDKIIAKALRTESRILCKLPVMIVFRGAGKKAIITDINRGGCRVEAEYQQTERNYIARSSDAVKIECKFPEHDQPITFSGIIRNVKKKKLILSYGVQFIDISDEVNGVIQKYIHSIKEKMGLVPVEPKSEKE